VPELETKGFVDILPHNTLQDLLKLDRPLRIKAGFDPTAADLHLGHMVLLNKLKAFQDLGHTIVFIIGDYTAKIGDPSGKNSTRPVLSTEEIQKNATTYKEQAGKILNIDKTEILFNSSWLNELSAADLIKLASHHTVARMLERDDFSKRFNNNQPIAIHEFLYPLIQGYDSVAINADIEIGGTDQTFNLLMGRELQKAFDKKQQTVMTLPLIEGLDGVQKMSKSLKNTIGITEQPAEIFGKLMSINDNLMWKYLSYITDIPEHTIKQWQAEVAAGANPKDYKLKLAYQCVNMLYNKEQAEFAYEGFNNRFSKKLLPENIPTTTIEVSQSIPISQLLKQASLVKSTSEALRLIKQKAILVNKQKISSNIELSVVTDPWLIQVGKHKIINIILKKAQ
jgi:tyrosyl-tRNA synthetase